MKAPRARVRGLPVRQEHLKKSLPLNRQIERIARLAEVALRLDYLRRRRPRAQSHLQSRPPRVVCCVAAAPGMIRF